MGKNKQLLLLLCAASTIQCHNPLYLNIAATYLPALHDSAPPVPPINQDSIIEPLTEDQTRLIAFKMLSQEPVTHQKYTVCAIDHKVWENLELYNGANLLNRLSRCSLKLGEACLGGLLGQPITLIPELERRQHIIRTLPANREFFGDLHDTLKKLSVLEPWFLTLWRDENSFLNEGFNRLYLAPGLPGADLVNRSPKLLGLFRRGEDIGTLLLLPFALLYIKHLFVKDGTYDLFCKNFSNVAQASGPLPELWLSLFFDSSQLIFSFLNVPISTYQTGQYLQATRATLRYLHAKLSYFAQTIAHLKNLHTLLARHRNQLTKFHECQPLFDLFETTNPDLHQLLELLKHPTFTKPFSYTSPSGLILVANKLLDRLKDDLIPPLLALGKLDAYCSCATLAQKAPFCFATYSTKDQPFISLIDLWNPLLTGTSVVNSLQLGYPHGNHIILTGQNTGGKSTVLKGVALNIILAQTLGITPAKQACITPFDCISTFMNITDNTKNNQSLFAAEVERAKQLLETIAAPPTTKKTFAIIDEAFKGTGGEAEGLSYWYAQQLGGLKNCMCINATHYPKLTRLEQETNGLYRNYKVEVIIGPNGKLMRPYKLERGCTLYNIAEHILVEQGLK